MMKSRLEILRGVVHRLGDRAGLEHLPHSVHGSVVNDDRAIGIALANLLEIATGHTSPL